MNTSDILQPIKVGTVWEQTAVINGGKPLKRIVEVLRRPTLSRPGLVLIKRNDAHPHRKGKTAAIRGRELRAKYEAHS